MLRLNSGVHSWLTKQERKRTAANADKHQDIDNLTQAMANNHIGNGHTTDTNNTSANTKDISTQSIDMNATVVIVDDEFHKQLKNEVGNMYNVWDEADKRLV